MIHSQPTGQSRTRVAVAVLVLPLGCNAPAPPAPSSAPLPPPTQSAAAPPTQPTPAPSSVQPEPAGWTLEECEAERARLESESEEPACLAACAEGGRLYPPDMMEIRGPDLDTRLDTEGTYVQIYPSGCWSTGSTRRILVDCEAVRLDHTIQVKPTFCLRSFRRPGGYALPDCGGAGIVTCPLGTLDPGVYLITSGNLHICVQIPSETPSEERQVEKRIYPLPAYCPP